MTDNRNIANIKYDDRLFSMSSIERKKLPELKRAFDILGPLKSEVARELGLNENIEVVVGTPDVQSAVIGSGAVRDYEGHLYLGTSSWITCHVPFKKTDLFHNIASLPAAIPNRYFVADEQETAGACLTFLKDILTGKKGESIENENQKKESIKNEDHQDIYSFFNESIKDVPAGSNGVIFTP